MLVFLLFLVFQDSFTKLLNDTVENVILHFVTEVTVIWGESIPADTIWGQPYINAIKESLKLQQFSSLNTRVRQGHLKLFARVVLLLNCIAAIFVLFLACGEHGFYQNTGQQVIAQHT